METKNTKTPDCFAGGNTQQLDGEGTAPFRRDRSLPKHMSVLPPEVASLAECLGPQSDEIIEAMHEQSAKMDFPTVGPEVGSWLSLLVGASGARRVFEFGSGFGYSGYWFARALPSDGEIVLTEVDEDELALAREFFEQAGLTDITEFEHGDAIATIDRYQGPFDIVLIDNEKQRYLEAFHAVREKLRPGSLVLADNAVTAGPIDREDVLAMLEGEHPPDPTEASRGIAEYLEHVRGRADLETSLLPLGEGVAVSLVR